ncbi:MAG: LruC domain-containing protein [Bacteroidota bacterium]
MKLKANTIILLLVLTFVILGTPSCKKADPTPVTTQATSINDLKVPAGFIFKTTKDVGINIRTLDNMDNAIANIRVGVYSDYPAQGGTCFVSGVTDAGGEFKLDYIFPAYLDSVVVATNAIGFANAQKFSVRDGALSCLLGGKHAVANLKDGGIFKSTLNNVYPMGTYNSSGVPNYLTPTNDPIDASMIQDINATLPEYISLVNSHPQYFAASNVQNLIVSEPSDVWVTFVHEGAGYLNVLGYYKYPTGNPPANPASIDSLHIIFPNVSFSGSGGGLTSGNRVHLGVFGPGTTIGWVLIADGFRNKTITSGNWTLYSDKNLNPEPNAALKQHTVLLNDIGRGKFLLSFEDIRRDSGSDNDFNDAVFYVTANPIQAIQTANFPIPNYTQVDTDGDGVSNVFDDYPTDPTKAFNNFYPNEGTTGTLAFEDLWPSKGDYDMNDMVIGYSYNQVTNGQNKVVQIKATFILKAMGAGYKNGFGFQLPISPSLVSSVTGTDLRESYITRNSNGTESGQSKATFIVFDNGFKLLPYPGDGNVGVNTTQGAAYVQPDTVHVVINLTTPTALSAIGTPPYNPFIIVNMERGKEVHMINHLPTDLANMAYLGTGADNSLASSGRYYVTKEGLPWVLDISSNFQYPTEKSEITQAYLKFIPWVESSGQSNYDWFQSKAGYRNTQKIYTH